MPVDRRRFSGWTVVVPLALTACIYVVASIIGSTRWTVGGSWRSVARRTHVSTARLHALNPRDTAKGRVVPGEHLMVRP
jgi:hypothetical protein